MLIINPGTEKQTKHNEKNAIEVAKQIAKDLKLTSKNWHRNCLRDRKDGWYGFVFKGKGGEIDVDIPGVDPKRVCKGEPFYSPRLYVDGSSWLYGYALNFIFDGIKKEIV